MLVLNHDGGLHFRIYKLLAVSNVNFRITTDIMQYWDFRERSLRAVTALKDHTTALKDHRGALNDPQVLEFQCKTHPQN